MMLLILRQFLHGVMDEWDVIEEKRLSSIVPVDEDGFERGDG